MSVDTEPGAAASGLYTLTAHDSFVEREDRHYTTGPQDLQTLRTLTTMLGDGALIDTGTVTVAIAGGRRTITIKTAGIEGGAQNQ